MAKYRDMGVVDCLHEAGCCFLGVLGKRRMWTGDHYVQLFEKTVWVIKFAIRQDVDLAASKDGDFFLLLASHLSDF